MHNGEFEALRALLDCMMSRERADELAETLKSVFGTMTAVVENIGGQGSLSSLTEHDRMLLSMIPQLYQKRSLEALGEHPLLDTLGKAGAYSLARYVNEQYECVRLFCLDGEYRLKECRDSATGGLREVNFYPRRLLQDALACEARALILCHNHPSDWEFFSEADINATRELLIMCARIDLPLLDHLLVAGGKINSMRSRAFLQDVLWMDCSSRMIPLARWRSELPPMT